MGFLAMGCMHFSLFRPFVTFLIPLLAIVFVMTYQTSCVHVSYAYIYIYI